MSKADRLDKLYNDYRKEFEGAEMVFGAGNADSRLVLIGEAPGRDEVRLGEPFVGAAGKNLSEFLEQLGLGRGDIYITNAIKYRLSGINPRTGRIVNRPAKTDEIEKNRRYLFNELEIIDPQYIVTLGNVPLRAVTLQNGISIGSVHGRSQYVQLGPAVRILFPLYHPASVIYNRSLKSEYVSDISKLSSILQSC